MKKLILGLAITPFFFACKGDYRCECTWSTGTTTTASTYIQVSKNDAKEDCDGLQSNYQTQDSGVTCVIVDN